MTLGIREATPDDRTDWTAFVASRPEGDVLQAWAWGEAGAGERGEHWRRLIVVDAAGHTRGVAQVLDRATLLGRTILYVPHGPLWDREASDAAEILARLIIGLRTHARERRGVVLKLDPRASGDAAQTAALARRARGRQVRDQRATTCRRLRHASSTSAAGDDPWRAGARTLGPRPDVRSAEGTVTRRRSSRRSGRARRIPCALSATSDRAGFRARSRSFLDALARPLAAAGDWFLALAEHDGRPLAGAVAARTGDRAFYLYAASTRDPELVAKRGPYAVMAALQRSLPRGRHDGRLDLWGVREADDAVGRSRLGGLQPVQATVRRRRRCAIRARSTSSSTRAGTDCATCVSGCATCGRDQRRRSPPTALPDDPQTTRGAIRSVRRSRHDRRRWRRPWRSSFTAVAFALLGGLACHRDASSAAPMPCRSCGGWRGARIASRVAVPGRPAAGPSWRASSSPSTSCSSTRRSCSWAPGSPAS